MSNFSNCHNYLKSHLQQRRQKASLCGKGFIIKAIVLCVSFVLFLTFSYGALNPINFLDGWHVDFDGLPSSLPFDTQGDFINYVRRVELLSDQVCEASLVFLCHTLS